MVFSSLLFLFRFLPATLLIYYVSPGKFRNFVLFAASLIFYAWGEPVYVLLILFSTVTDYMAGRLIGHFRQGGRPVCTRLALLGSILINLSLLGYFKYAGFLLEQLQTLTSIPLSIPETALPIGISFYTFQTMSYTIDVYRGDTKIQKNFIAFGAYVTFFPQLIAGPIVRYRTVAPQLTTRKESIDSLSRGILRFTAGLGKKVIIANQIGELWNTISTITGTELTGATAWLGILAFTMQIYFDFSGYSDMAIGLGLMFGFHFPENFRHPYESRSVTEFWRRWHISLGTWFREYVYIPLGGNRNGVPIQIRNLAVVWLLTGLWHGASWNFVLWGIYYGILLISEKFILKTFLDKLPALVRHIYTFLAIMIGWSIFSLPDMADGAGYLKALVFHSEAGAVNGQTMYLLFSNFLLLAVAAIFCTSAVQRPVNRLFPPGSRRKALGEVLFTAGTLMWCVALLINSAYNPFLYFRF